MDYRIVWVHGIGPTRPGYSKDWDQTYNLYLNFPLSDFREVYWADVYSSTMSVDNLGTNMITMPLTTQVLCWWHWSVGRLMVFLSGQERGCSQWLGVAPSTS